VPARQQKGDDFQYEIFSMKIEGCAEYKATDEELAQWG
jgi:hypothetical protein